MASIKCVLSLTVKPLLQFYYMLSTFIQVLPSTNGPFAPSGLPLQVPLPHAECPLVRGQQAGVLLLLHHAQGLLGPLTTVVIVHRYPTAQTALLPAFPGEILPESQAWLHICITFTLKGVLSL